MFNQLGCAYVAKILFEVKRVRLNLAESDRNWLLPLTGP